MNRYGLSLALAAFAALATLLLTASTDAAQYEGTPTFSPSQALPGVPLHGADYSIGERVPVENFQYVFTVNTKWGPFRIKNSDLLRVRLREIAATAKLEEVNGARDCGRGGGGDGAQAAQHRQGSRDPAGANDRRYVPRRRPYLRKRAGHDERDRPAWRQHDLLGYGRCLRSAQASLQSSASIRIPPFRRLPIS